jgi:hypothetical protein
MNTTIKFCKITNDAGREFQLRIVEVGDAYGRNNCLIHDKAEYGPMVEFWDMTHNQFVSRYYIETLLESPNERNYNLSLCGYEPVWTIDANTMQTVYQFIEGWAK